MVNDSIDKYFADITHPPVLFESENFLIKLAENPEERLLAQKLRYRVFREEQGRLEDIDSDGVDQDAFDEYCLHLLVMERKKGEIVGTYRIHPGKIAPKKLGFYSATEYELKGIDLIAESSIEMGRSCVASEYRNGAVVALLWNGIAELQRRNFTQYLFGCVSLENKDRGIAWALFDYFERKNLVDYQRLRGVAKEHVRMDKITDKIGKMTDQELLSYLPPLFKGYLRLGVKICGEPVYDSEFGSIDFLILLDFMAIPDKYRRHFGLL